MAAPPILVLPDHVDLGGLTDEPGRQWTEIECASKKAYGCGEHDGQEALEGLKLYVRHGGGRLLTSSLAIRMSDDAHRRFYTELELGAPSKDMLPRRMQAHAFVTMAEEQDLTVIVLAFQRPFRRGLVYYLVYDHVDASLAMIKYLPDLYSPTATTMKPVVVVPKRRRHGSDDLELFIVAFRRLGWSPPAPREVVCVCTPETRANPSCAWQVKTPCFQRKEILGPYFHADEAFSFQGKGVWADLSKGLVYCDLLHTTSDDPAAVDFGFIPLPPECQPNLTESEYEMEWQETKLNRAMACVRDSSIWFVCIHRAEEYDADDIVKMWTLNVPAPGGNKLQESRWEQVEEVPVSVLWGLDGFKEAGLPRWPLICPALTTDGALCVMLDDQSRFPKQVMPGVDKFCIFKLHGEKRLLFHGLVHDYYFSEPVLCPPNFLQRKHS